MKYIKTKGNIYHAIDTVAKLVYSVRVESNEKTLQIRNEAWYAAALELLDCTEITAVEFQKQFSECVDYFHTETPFA